jgi:hypothetical protein
MKTFNAADNALDAYKTSKSFSTLQKAEMGFMGWCRLMGWVRLF